MKSQIYINLCVKDLAKSEALYTAMGFQLNPAFSDDSGRCLVWSEEIYLMLLSEEKMKSFATKPLADTKEFLCGINSIQVDSLDKVNSIAQAAYAAGATEPRPFADYGFMQFRVVEDFDGHTWEFLTIDMSKFPDPNQS
ncbi:MAG TPA: hypothetical protein PK006_10335 [Saprospiraceae bacterium]|nr:hypothetical protein [Saprospiraceae bacterium]